MHGAEIKTWGFFGFDIIKMAPPNNWEEPLLKHNMATAGFHEQEQSKIFPCWM
jgi:hypothetical protein